MRPAPKVATITATLTIALTLTACSSGSTDTDPGTDNTTEAEAETEDETAVTADQVETELLNAFGGIDDFNELGTDQWAYYITDIEMLNDTTAAVTFQLEPGDPLLDGTSRNILSLIGNQLPTLNWVETRDSTGATVEQTQRADIPTLN